MDGLSPNEESLDKEPSAAEAPATGNPNRGLLDTVRAALRERTDPLRATVLELWRRSTVREERYAAIDLTSLRVVARDQLMLPVYEEIIRTGAWWDFVDGHRIVSSGFFRPTGP